MYFLYNLASGHTRLYEVGYANRIIPHHSISIRHRQCLNGTESFTNNITDKEHIYYTVWTPSVEEVALNETEEHSAISIGKIAATLNILHAHIAGF